jgi:hypothetical protein
MQVEEGARRSCTSWEQYKLRSSLQRLHGCATPPEMSQRAPQVGTNPKSQQDGSHPAKNKQSVQGGGEARNGRERSRRRPAINPRWMWQSPFVLVASAALWDSTSRRVLLSKRPNGKRYQGAPMSIPLVGYRKQVCQLWWLKLPGIIHVNVMCRG